MIDLPYLSIKLKALKINIILIDEDRSSSKIILFLTVQLRHGNINITENKIKFGLIVNHQPNITYK